MAQRSVPLWRLRAAASLLLAALTVAPGLAPLVTASAPPSDSPPPAPMAILNVTAFTDTRYLIVTAAAYAPTMQEIADWKTQKGLPASVALIEDIKATYDGRDDAERLHNFLQDVYFNATGSQLKYVLLGGGAAVLPIRYLRTNGSVITWYTHDDIVSDVYYAGLNSNWDTNQNGIYGEYGEEDWDANVYVGRMAFNNSAEATIAKDNLLSYEKSPSKGAWMRKATAFASVMDPPNNVDTNPYDWWEDNAIRSVWQTQGYVASGMSLDILADYYEIYGGNYTPAQDRLSTTSMVNAISGGSSVVMSVTHGWVPSGKGVPEYTGTNGVDYSWGQGLTYVSAPSLTNYGALSFGYFSSCLVGNFSNPDLPNLARFSLLDNHGFVAMVLPSDGTMRGEDDYPRFSEGNWWQSENYWKNFFTGPDPYRPGPALYQGIRDYDRHIKEIDRLESSGHYRTQKAVYNLLGDPEVPIWTDVALDFGVSLPTTLYTAEQHFRATFRDQLSRPLAGATVALSGAGVYVVTTTDAQGRVDVVIHPTTTGGITVTATQHNVIPLQVTIPVTRAPADLSIEPSNVALPSPILKTGVPVTVSFTVRNVGEQPSAATDARVYETPPGSLPQLLGGPIPIPALAPGDPSSATFDWTPAVDGVHILRIVVDLAGAVAEFDELNNEVNIPVPVSSVDLSIAPGSVALDPPGQVAPGSILRVSGTVEHVGVLPRGYLIGYQVLREDGSFVLGGNLEASTSLTTFAFTLVIGETGQFVVRVTADSGGAILEFNETNNTVDAPVRAGSGPSVYSLPPLLLDEDSGRAVAIPDLAVFVSDPDTPFDRLLFSVSSSTPPLQLWVEGHGLIALPAADWFGNGSLTLTVSDGTYTYTTSATFVVRAAPDAPWIAPPPTLQATVGDAVVYAIEAHDADGDALFFASLTPGVAVGASSGHVTFVATDAMVGTTTVRLTVTDGRFVVPVNVPLVVLPPDASPTLVTTGPFIVRAGDAATWTLVAHDPEGEPVTFGTSWLSTGVQVTANGTLTLSAAQTRALGPQTLVIGVTMSDGLHTSAGEVVIIVQEPSPPSNASGYGSQGAAFAATLSVVAAAAAGLAVTLSRSRAARRQ